MSKKFSAEPLRGMEDYYPEDLRELNWIIENIKDIAERYAFEEFASPQIEPIEIFAAKSSEELVNEQSFIIEKKKGERLILIPELTPSLARMISRKSQELKKPIRWFSVPTCFRYERPQRGRRREFKQINFDILAEESLYADLEIFMVIVDVFKQFGADSSQFQIYYNNRRFIDSVCKFILKVNETDLPLIYKILDKSDKMEESEFMAFVQESFKEENIVQGIYKIKDSNSLDELISAFNNVPEEFYETDGYKELNTFNDLIKDANITEYCTFSPKVVRGLDYYTGIVYEVFDTGEKNIRSIFGGGRYDDLLSMFSDEKITGTGFGMGTLMLSLFLKTYDLIPPEIRDKDYTDTIYIASINEKVSKYALKLAKIVRNEEFPCVIDYRFKGLGNQLSKANELGVLISLIVGPKEMEQDKVTIKNMKTEDQKTIKLESLIDEIYAIFDEFESI
ncbi:MAG: histidine--tRNA ligase [Promethearchaeota archaeon]|nr:MAG: histidine--tRNA ligase [Candidatus Lokiarchaeota archaeon]